ncbi:hypothetical protein [Agrococcus sp. ARC_14]|uniref:hypothetical protein n=1 Tax=Agrococcus sp. ARC_14 TaxID=2919927 RepID=UPI001F054EA3|nr:hypothetical protein [Agrococcus sp. ARC_14]MCH1883389.1 hypothetical protein [Agrococcus sp. ARC_14]
MTDANEERPLTRRELRARERAEELATTGGVPPVPGDDEQRASVEEPAHLGRHSTPSVPAAAHEAESEQQAEPVDAEPVDAEPVKPLGRFFGRKKGKGAQEKEPEAQDAAPATAEPAETVAIQQVDPGAAEGVDALEAELAEPEAPSAPAPADASVPAPSSARRSSAQIDDVQGLDTVSDAEVDDLEIDEVVVQQPRVSSRRIAEVTPAELEDRRQALEDADDTVVAGPSRGQSQRLPVIVNVVPDTSEHHIADLREQGVAGSGGTSTSSITANALVLPAGSESPDFTLEGDDGLLVTGSIDVPEGFASSGRGRAAIDGNDVDSDVAEGEVTSPETAPVRASKAVSSYANARVQIAPKKQRPNVWPVAIGVGAGGFAVAVAGFLALALSQGWL